VNKHVSPIKGGESAEVMSSLLKSPLKTKLHPLGGNAQNSNDMFKKMSGLQGSNASVKGGAVMADHALSSLVVQPSKFV
jgi:hypothetical protein